MTLKRIARKAPPKRVNRLRKKREFERAYHSEERVLFVRGLGCVIGTAWCLEGWDSGEPIENAHIRTGGTGRKADYAEIVPLCQSHHKALHQWGRADFEKHYKIDLTACAETTQKLWLTHNPGNLQ